MMGDGKMWMQPIFLEGVRKAQTSFSFFEWDIIGNWNVEHINGADFQEPEIEVRRTI